MKKLGERYHNRYSIFLLNKFTTDRPDLYIKFQIQYIYIYVKMWRCVRIYNIEVMKINSKSDLKKELCITPIY
jgi:hypothetical protein